MVKAQLSPPEAIPAVPAPPARTRKGKLFRGARRLVTRTLMAIACVLVPRLYTAYMRFVWATSRVEDHGISRLHALTEEHDGMICALWHDEVFSVAWSYREFNGHTLASVGDAGEVITRMLQRCGYTVLRGGSTGSKSRKREDVLGALIDNMKTHHKVTYGITVDGAKGPAHVFKRGVIVVAKECRKPIAVVRTWAKRNIRLNTWDRMAIPLPFNVIHQYLVGPYPIPADGIDDPVAFEAFRKFLEDDLLRLTERSEIDLAAA
jgi:lysophospholipid acyltransferase (LPLAT)-like uncharacterized protein